MVAIVRKKQSSSLERYAKSVLQYLLKPLYKSKDALRER